MHVLLIGQPATDPESLAAVEWLAGHGFVSRVADPRDADGPALDWADVVWCHGQRWPIEAGTEVSDPLRNRVRHGGVVLSLAGCVLPHLCGMDPVSPIIAASIFVADEDPLWDAGFRDWPDFPQIRGLQGWSGAAHPLFDGFQGGTYTRQLRDGDSQHGVGFDWPLWPGGGARVIAVERAYVRLNSRRAVAWEYPAVRRVIALGSHVELGTQDPLLRVQRDRLIGNALSLAASHATSGAECFWPLREPWTTRDTMPAPPLPPLESWLDGGDSLRVTSRGDDAPFTIAGRRALVVGTERSGVKDIWIHPLGVVTGGIRLGINDDEARPAQCQISPLSIERTFAGRDGLLVERIAPAMDEPAVLIEYAGHLLSTLSVALTLPLRLEWPFDADALQPLVVRHFDDSNGTHAVTVMACDGRHCACVVAEGARSVRLDPGGPDLAPALRLDALGGVPLRLLISAGSVGAESLIASLESLGGLAQRRREHFNALHSRSVQMESADPQLDNSVAWAIHRLDMFVAVTPDGGRGLLAGYAAAREGWSVSRPGYAWFFGRDACWSADAMLAAGMFEEVRDIVLSLAATRDITGKVIHELTTSGVAHYDAADATPLFLRLVAAYGEWSGDLATMREVWPAVRDAFEFAASTDHDLDGLLENDGVGHGWIESGPLGGGRVTSYMAAVWIDALRRLLPLAEEVEDRPLAKAAASMLSRAERAVELRLRDPKSGRLVLQLDRQGLAVTDLTALSAVPIALGVDEGAAASTVLDALTSPPFCAQWGVRMLPTTDPRYDPQGYHSGAVWPLFTGWTATACFERGRSADGLRLLRANAQLSLARAKGAFDEVLDGNTGAGAGVCPDQAWSAAMVVFPAVCGLWGVQPLSRGRGVRLRLQLPDDWPSASLRGVRIGSSRLDVEMQQRVDGADRRMEVEVRHLSGPQLFIVAEIRLGEGQRAHAELLDDGDASSHAVDTRLSGIWGSWRFEMTRPQHRLIIHVTAPS